METIIHINKDTDVHVYTDGAAIYLTQVTGDINRGIRKVIARLKQGVWEPFDSRMFRHLLDYHADEISTAIKSIRK